VDPAYLANRPGLNFPHIDPGFVGQSNCPEQSMGLGLCLLAGVGVELCRRISLTSFPRCDRRASFCPEQATQVPDLRDGLGGGAWGHGQSTAETQPAGKAAKYLFWTTIGKNCPNASRGRLR
jgi:hypothetical protein